MSIIIVVELHFPPFLLAAVSFVILCGIVDDCSDGSVMTVVSGSVSDFRSFHKDVKFVKRAFVDNAQVHFILCVLTKCSFYFVCSDKMFILFCVF